MTVIVGYKDGDNVYIGGDSAGVNGYNITVRADDKVFNNKDFTMGFTSSFRMGQLLRYSFNPPDHPVDMDTAEYVNTLFVDAIRACLKQGGFAKIESGEETGGTFLVAYKGELFIIYDDYQVAIPSDGYAAVGCGRNLALGSLYSTGNIKSPKVKVTKALEAAEKFSAGVRGPFKIIKNKYNRK